MMESSSVTKKRKRKRTNSKNCTVDSVSQQQTSNDKTDQCDTMECSKEKNSLHQKHADSVASCLDSNKQTKTEDYHLKTDSDSGVETASVSETVVSEKSPDKMISQIQTDNQFFTRVIDMIPPQFYFDTDTQEHIISMRAESGSAVKKGSKFKRPSEDVNIEAVKKARFNPDLNQTSNQMMDHFGLQTSKNYSKPGVRHPAERGSTDHLELVREKLHEKLEELKKQRHGGNMAKGVYNSEKMKLKRRESKLKRKMKLKLEKTHKTAPIPPVNGNVPKQSGPIFNKDGKLVFSKFDFSDFSQKHKDKPKSEFTGKNYQKLLAKVEKRNEKLKKLKESDPQRAESVEEKMKWQAALQRAEGVKVKDNPELLKKSIKSQEKKKQSRQKKWDDRLDRTEKMKEEKQQKRQKNIKAQKLKNLDKKAQKLKKKGRLIPGF